MNEIFHTEDCGISLLCRCCRAPVCEQRLSKADRLRVRRELWAPADWRGRNVCLTGHDKRYPRSFFSTFTSGLSACVTRLLSTFAQERRDP
jgi:hypothetical protein